MTGTDDVKNIEGVIQSYLDGLYESELGQDCDSPFIRPAP